MTADKKNAGAASTTATPPKPRAGKPAAADPASQLTAALATLTGSMAEQTQALADIRTTQGRTVEVLEDLVTRMDSEAEGFEPEEATREELVAFLVEEGELELREAKRLHTKRLRALAAELMEAEEVDEDEVDEDEETFDPETATRDDLLVFIKEEGVMPGKLARGATTKKLRSVVANYLDADEGESDEVDLDEMSKAQLVDYAVDGEILKKSEARRMPKADLIKEIRVAESGVIKRAFHWAKRHPVMAIGGGIAAALGISAAAGAFREQDDETEPEVA